MKRSSCRLAAAIVCCVIGIAMAWAQPKPEATFTYGIGTAHLADTYLSPLKYSGWGMRLGYDRWSTLSRDRWQMRLQTALETQHGSAVSHSGGQLWAFGVDAQWAAMRRIARQSSAMPVSISAGGAAMFAAGAYYNQYNGNNPANAKAMAAVGASVGADWRTQLFGRKLRLQASASMPLLGAFFCPEYGELYYEIYLGDRQGLVHFAHPGSYLRVDAEVSAYLTLGRHVLQLGYRLGTLSAHANHLTNNLTTHALVIGIGLD